MSEHWYDGCYESREWRLNHLYHVLDKHGKITRFRMNWAQEELYRNLWHRNNILKARQLGMSTFTSIFILDSMLHIPDFQAGIIDKTQDDGQEKLGKIKLAYDLLAHPEDIPYLNDFVTDAKEREKIALYGQAITRTIGIKPKDLSVRLTNGAKVRVGTSLRGGTMQFLHVSEFGSVAANAPKKATEILSGGINAVPDEGVVVMESTHEGGKYGENYRLTKIAMENVGRELSIKDFRFFFFPWHKQPEYRVAGTSRPTRLADYWRELEGKGVVLDDEQKRWYEAQERTFGFLVRREFPSTPEEAFEQQIEGSIYGSVISRLRSQGCMAAEFEVDNNAPLYVSWDLGLSDYTAMWLWQPRGNGKHYVLDYYCANNQLLSHYIAKVQEWEREHGQLITKHLLPHDSTTRNLSGTSVFTQLTAAKFRCSVVTRTKSLWASIYATRDLLTHCVFARRCNNPVVVDGVEYMAGVDALENYQMRPDGAGGVEHNEPLHNACSHGADAFRMYAEALALGMVGRERADALRPPKDAGRRLGRGVPSHWGRK